MIPMDISWGSCINGISKKLESELHSDEKAFRYGGDEFVVYTPKTGFSLQKFINQLERNVQALPQSIEGNFIIVKYSLGGSEYRKDTRSVTEMVKIADKYVYQQTLNFLAIARKFFISYFILISFLIP